jgi:hypothetical protein
MKDLSLIWFFAGAALLGTGLYLNVGLGAALIGLGALLLLLFGFITLMEMT